MTVWRVFPVVVFGAAVALFASLALTQDHSEAERTAMVKELERVTGLRGAFVSGEDFANGKVPAGFAERTGASYKPSYNEDPDIPEQCWIETSYVGDVINGRPWGEDGVGTTPTGIVRVNANGEPVARKP